MKDSEFTPLSHRDTEFFIGMVCRELRFLAENSFTINFSVTLCPPDLLSGWPLWLMLLGFSVAC